MIINLSLLKTFKNLQDPHHHQYLNNLINSSHVGASSSQEAAIVQAGDSSLFPFPSYSCLNMAEVNEVANVIDVDVDRCLQGSMLTLLMLLLTGVKIVITTLKKYA